MIYTEENLRQIIISTYKYKDIAIKTINNKNNSVLVIFTPKISYSHYQSTKSIEIDFQTIRDHKLKNLLS